MFGLLSDEYIGDPSRGFLPVFVKRPNEPIVRGGLLVVIPFFSVGSDKVLVVRLDGQKRVYGLEGRRRGFTVIRHILVDEDGSGWNLRRIRQNAEFEDLGFLKDLG